MKPAASKLGLYLITDEGLSCGRATVDVVRAAIMGGVDAVQFRGKGLGVRDQVALATELRRVTHDAGVLFIVNDRADVARVVEADGVHVGPEDLPPERARLIVGPDRLVGFSASTVSEARWGRDRGADYLGVGAMYATTTKADAGEPVGPERIGDIAKVVALPLVGIGGITAERVVPVIRAGAVGVAVISAIVAAPNVTAAARDFKARLLQARAACADHS